MPMILASFKRKHSGPGGLRTDSMEGGTHTRGRLWKQTRMSRWGELHRSTCHEPRVTNQKYLVGSVGLHCREAIFKLLKELTGPKRGQKQERGELRVVAMYPGEAD